MYVGDRPSFDGCLASICLSSRPQDFPVRYLDRFHLFTVLTIFSPAKTRVAIDTRTLPSQINTIVTDNTLSGDGWLLGGGGYFDPCLDRSAERIVIIMYIIFGALLAVVVADGVRRACCCRRSWHQQPGTRPGWCLIHAHCLSDAQYLLHDARCTPHAARCCSLLCAAACCSLPHLLHAARAFSPHAHTPRTPSSSPLHNLTTAPLPCCCTTVVKYGKYGSLIAKAMAYASALGSLLYFASMITDLVTDVLVLVELLPRLPGWLLLAAVFVADAISTVYSHRWALRACGMIVAQSAAAVAAVCAATAVSCS